MITAKEAQDIQETLKGDNSRLDIIAEGIKQQALNGYNSHHLSLLYKLSEYELSELGNSGFNVTRQESERVDMAYYYTIKW